MICELMLHSQVVSRWHSENNAQVHSPPPLPDLFRDRLDHQSEEQHSMRKTYQKEIHQLKESLRDKHDELDVMKRERR